MKTILAVGAHIGDMDLTAGPVLAEAARNGDRAVLLAATPGEAGHPNISPVEYKGQKIAEGKAFAAHIGAEFRMLDYADGFLPASDDAALAIADIIRELRPDILIAHWKNSFHSDHRNASYLAGRARFFAGLPIERAHPPHSVSTTLFAENWEDAEDFIPSRYTPISEEAFITWKEAIQGQAFARGETSGFRYIDFYTAQLTTRGCLADTPRACAFATPNPVLGKAVAL